MGLDHGHGRDRDRDAWEPLLDAARGLDPSAVTVRRHVSQVVRKLGVRDRKTALELLRNQSV